MQKSCKTCGEPAGVYALKCPECRTRMALSEPCKVIRQYIVRSMETRYGEVENWKVEPNCGCKGNCERLANVQKQKILGEDERVPLRGVRKR